MPTPTPVPTPAPTPAPTTRAPSAVCSAENEDPYGRGSHIPCCGGLEQCIGDWKKTGNFYYACLKSCSAGLTTATTTPAPAPAPRPPSWGACKVGVGFSLYFQQVKLDPSVAVKRLRELGVQCVRLWGYDPVYLKALLDNGIRDVLVNVPTRELKELSSSFAKAQQVAKTIKPFYDQGMGMRMAVANEPVAAWEDVGANGPLLPQALENMIRALKDAGMPDVTVTVPFDLSTVHDTYPPSKGRFSDTTVEHIRKVAAILWRTGGEFTMQVYPFFGRMSNPKDISLPLALGRQDAVVDGRTYAGLLGLQVAATRAAMIKLDSRYATMPLTIGETGWPTGGHADATVANAKDFINNAIRATKRLDAPLDPYLRTVYLFEAFDEQMKSGLHHGGTSSTTENNFGLFYESGQLKFPLAF